MDQGHDAAGKTGEHSRGRQSPTCFVSSALARTLHRPGQEQETGPDQLLLCTSVASLICYKKGCCAEQVAEADLYSLR